MKRLFSFILCTPLILTGCWNSQDISESAFVQGIGLDKDGNEIKGSIEIIKPTSAQAGQSGGKSSGNHIILELRGDSLIEIGREFIRITKRRLNFGHTNTIIIGEELAKETDFPLALDVLRRDQMFRLNGYLFISDKDPREIFNIPTLYEDLSSTELVSVLEQTKFISVYTPTKLYEFYRFLIGHHFNAYVPIISVQDSVNQKVTAITGTAVIKNNKMVGKLNIKESTGLNWLLNLVKGGTITAMLGERDRASLEVKKAKTKIVPHLEGKQLKIDIQTEIEGTLADNMTLAKLNESFLKKVEKRISQEVEGLMLSSINKLQELETDITDFGLIIHQTSPKEWKRIEPEWDDIFANAEINIEVNTLITHQGLTNESLHPEQQKPDNNPYRFFKSFFSR
ncbi:Ger(x)C family spore germination protein [Mesobacillus jeotgali]|uniref:Ger(x)C family spore germination protein n=1 Tax=Mesobacillus jeotgali TaxID=129985 RepID=UPI0009A62331|nr:Ger(x)C family spore germination protein [Mesobacillus jeotgali]